MCIKKIIILFSGSGTNLENIILKLHNKVFNGTKIVIEHTICNVPAALGIEKAKSHGIAVSLLDHKKFSTRDHFDKSLASKIKSHNPDLVILAGFMRILSPVFIQDIRAINLHPSLLPLFKGANAIEDSWNSNESLAGVSVHFVNSELDGGEIIEQVSFSKKSFKNIKDFEAKIHTLEYELLPKVIINLLTSPS